MFPHVYTLTLSFREIRATQELYSPGGVVGALPSPSSGAPVPVALDLPTYSKTHDCAIILELTTLKQPVWYICIRHLMKALKCITLSAIYTVGTSIPVCSACIIYMELCVYSTLYSKQTKRRRKKPKKPYLMKQTNKQQ